MTMHPSHSMTVALTWCLAWGEQRQPQLEWNLLEQTRQALHTGTAIPPEPLGLVNQVQQLQDLPFPDTLASLEDNFPELWQQKTKIGLVYGGATKIKGYVFESAKLSEIRGASALLDRINLVDLPAFFGVDSPETSQVRHWLDTEFPGLSSALIPELIIYSTGGNLLAFCPAAYVNDLANAIEKRYTTETLTANSCAVGDSFRLLEVRLGLLHDSIKETPWLDWYRQHYQDSIVESYFGRVSESGIQEAFENRKSFNELAGKLAAQFNARRSGNDTPNRPSRCYPPMFETHPDLVRDESDRALAMFRATRLPGEPWFSEPLARKYYMGQQAKREARQSWYRESDLDWQPGDVDSWVRKFERFLRQPENQHYLEQYISEVSSSIEEAKTLEEIGNSSSGFVSFIYADGNNMGGYIQKIRTPQEYSQFSQDIFAATEQSVYRALATHLSPQSLQGLNRLESKDRNGVCVHPFEIITIGGDDVLLIVPATKALAIAKTIGEEFEKILAQKGRYAIPPSSDHLAEIHRYRPQTATASRCQLSMSIGVLTISHSTPIYYAENLTNQLLKSAKKKAKYLKKHYHYYGGTVDILTLKSVTMITSNLEAFRQEALVKESSVGQTQLQLYATPYTLHELGGLIETIQAFKNTDFPRSQLYQIRSLLEQGKHTAILNYRYFRVRLPFQQQQLLQDTFEKAWCEAKTNNGNLAPWIYDSQQQSYETIWRDIVDHYPFIPVPTSSKREIMQ